MIGNFQCEQQLITLAMLEAANPSGTTEHHQEILPALNKFALGYEINTPKKIAHFLSQISVESNFKNIEENLRYSSRRMKEIFGCKSGPHGSQKFYISNGDVVCNFGQLRSKLWTHTAMYENNAINLGGYVYADRYGNGSESSGDGYKYRGRGLIQTTFKDNYKILTREHNSRFPGDKQDFVENPDLLLSDLQYGIESAFVYWTVTRPQLNATADSANVRAITQLVNGGDHGLVARRKIYNDLTPLLGLPLDEV